MEISEDGKNFIKRREACRLTPHFDGIGGVTDIGFGHVLTEAERPWHSITIEEAHALFDIDALYYGSQVSEALTVDVSQWAFDCICSWTYNVGGSAMRNSTLMKYVNADMQADAIVELLTWNKGGGRVIDGLLLRRAKEALIWARGEYR